MVFVVISVFVSDFTNLVLFPPHFSQICQGLVNLVYFVKGPTSCFIDYLYELLVSNSLILALIFITSFLLVLDLA
jgi:hypothetical protein